MDIFLTSPYGVMPTYEVAMTSKTSLLDLYKSIIWEAGSAQAAIDAITNLNLGTYADILNSKLYDPATIRMRVMKQVMNPKSVAKITGLSPARAALLQMFYAKAGLSSYGDDAVYTEIGKQVSGSPYTMSDLAGYSILSLFFNYVFIKETTEAIRLCSNMVEAGKTGNYVGTEVVYGISNILETYSNRIKALFLRGVGAQPFSTDQLIRALRNYAAYRNSDKAIAHKNSDREDAYGMIPQVTMQVDSIANMSELLSSVAGSEEEKTALPGALSRFVEGLNSAKENKIIYWTALSTYVADLLPYGTLRVSGGDLLVAESRFGMKGASQAYEFTPTRFGGQIQFLPTVTAQLFGAVDAEKAELDSLIAAAKEQRRRHIEVVPSTASTVLSYCKSAITNANPLLKQAIVREVGSVIYDSGSSGFVYYIPFTVNTVAACAPLGATVVNGFSVTNDLDAATILALLVQNGTMPDLKPRMPIGDADPKRVYSLELAQSVDRAYGGRRINTQNLSFRMSLPGYNTPVTKVVDNLLEPLGVYGKSVRIMDDIRSKSWAESFAYSLQGNLNEPEDLFSSSQAIIEYGLGLISRSRAKYGDLVATTLDTVVGPARPSDTMGSKVVRNRLISINAVSAYTAALRVISPEVGSIITKMFRLSVTVAKGSGVNLIAEAP